MSQVLKTRLQAHALQILVVVGAILCLACSPSQKPLASAFPELVPWEGPHAARQPVVEGPHAAPQPVVDLRIRLSKIAIRLSQLADRDEQQAHPRLQVVHAL